MIYKEFNNVQDAFTFAECLAFANVKCSLGRVAGVWSVSYRKHSYNLRLVN